jgi:hypothetical protein
MNLSADYQLIKLRNTFEAAFINEHHCRLSPFERACNRAIRVRSFPLSRTQNGAPKPRRAKRPGWGEGAGLAVPGRYTGHLHVDSAPGDGLVQRPAGATQRFPGTEETRLWRPNAIRLRQSVEVLWVCSYISAGAAGGRIR